MVPSAFHWLAGEFRSSQEAEEIVPVMSRYLTVGLLGALAVLGVAFTVVMGFYLVIQQLGDQASARVLEWVGGVCLVLLVINFVLLVISLALDSLAPPDRSEPDD